MYNVESLLKACISEIGYWSTDISIIGGLQHAKALGLSNQLVVWDFTTVLS